MPPRPSRRTRTDLSLDRASAARRRAPSQGHNGARHAPRPPLRELSFKGQSIAAKLRQRMATDLYVTLFFFSRTRTVLTLVRSWPAAAEYGRIGPTVASGATVSASRPLCSTGRISARLSSRAAREARAMSSQSPPSSTCAARGAKAVGHTGRDLEQEKAGSGRGRGPRTALAHRHSGAGCF